MGKISVVICSRNRARLLENTLESLCRAAPPQRLTWEVVVILNDCTDHSAVVVGQLRDRLPLVCQAEPRPGLSNARNKGIDVASGDVFIWIDDDVRVTPGWLRGYEEAFMRWPETSLFGGAILPEFEGNPPAWLLRSWHLCDSAFAARRVPHADAPIVLTDNYPPYGANFALRACMQRQFRYDIALGARPGNWMMSGEETEVMQAALAGGATGRWVRAAIVHHIMPPERQSLAYVQTYYEGAGRQSGLRSRRRGPPPSRAEGLHDLGRAILLQAQYRGLRAVLHSRYWVPALVKAAVARGWWIGRHRSPAPMG
ncbi:MAG TPA: glycosyltransferase [Xanthobacteraceae bacterium]|jgi:glycosyltransferase involved in cell wall biosynthesis